MVPAPPSTIEPSTRLPEFGSPAHLDWIRARLSKNLRFRFEVEAAERRALAAYRSRREAAS